ncbi:MAG: hypothetical protein BGO27_02830 [Alphaproteobacteria bacterium 33-17]|nr:MAG: hypothetical protein BGO27_02830 [Alphaproteobacteria bacterium 33-17]
MLKPAQIIDRRIKDLEAAFIKNNREPIEISVKQFQSDLLNIYFESEYAKYAQYITVKKTSRMEKMRYGAALLYKYTRLVGVNDVFDVARNNKKTTAKLLLGESLKYVIQTIFPMVASHAFAVKSVFSYASFGMLSCIALNSVIDVKSRQYAVEIKEKYVEQFYDNKFKASEEAMLNYTIATGNSVSRETIKNSIGYNFDFYFNTMHGACDLSFQAIRLAFTLHRIISNPYSSATVYGAGYLINFLPTLLNYISKFIECSRFVSFNDIKTVFKMIRGSYSNYQDLGNFLNIKAVLSDLKVQSNINVADIFFRVAGNNPQITQQIAASLSINNPIIANIVPKDSTLAASIQDKFSSKQNLSDFMRYLWQAGDVASLKIIISQVTANLKNNKNLLVDIISEIVVTNFLRPIINQIANEDFSTCASNKEVIDKVFAKLVNDPDDKNIVSAKNQITKILDLKKLDAKIIVPQLAALLLSDHIDIRNMIENHLVNDNFINSIDTFAKQALDASSDIFIKDTIQKFATSKFTKVINNVSNGASNVKLQNLLINLGNIVKFNPEISKEFKSKSENLPPQYNALKDIWEYIGGIFTLPALTAKYASDIAGFINSSSESILKINAVKVIDAMIKTDVLESDQKKSDTSAVTIKKAGLEGAYRKANDKTRKILEDERKKTAHKSRVAEALKKYAFSFKDVADVLVKIIGMSHGLIDTNSFLAQFLGKFIIDQSRPDNRIIGQEGDSITKQLSGSLDTLVAGIRLDNYSTNAIANIYKSEVDVANEIPNAWVKLNAGMQIKIPYAAHSGFAVADMITKTMTGILGTSGDSKDTKTLIRLNSNLEVLKGKVIQFSGQTGGGKSVTTAILSDFWRLFSGKMERDKNLKPESIIYIPQEAPPILGNLTVYEFMTADLKNEGDNKVYFNENGSLKSDEIKVKIRSLMAGVALDNKYYEVDNGVDPLNESFGGMSGGQKMRVLLVRAMLNLETRLLILDESISSLPDQFGMLTKSEIHHILCATFNTPFNKEYDDHISSSSNILEMSQRFKDSYGVPDDINEIDRINAEMHMSVKNIVMSKIKQFAVNCNASVISIVHQEEKHPLKYMPEDAVVESLSTGFADVMWNLRPSDQDLSENTIDVHNLNVRYHILNKGGLLNRSELYLRMFADNRGINIPDNSTKTQIEDAIIYHYQNQLIKDTGRTVDLDDSRYDINRAGEKQKIINATIKLIKNQNIKIMDSTIQVERKSQHFRSLLEPTGGLVPILDIKEVNDSPLRVNSVSRISGDHANALSNAKKSLFQQHM